MNINVNTELKNSAKIAKMVCEYLHHTAHEADHLTVDTTSTRARTGEAQLYSGYKKQRVVKVQVLCCDTGLVRHVSNGHTGEIYDKRIWNLEFPGIPRHPAILADRAYAGAIGDGAFVYRPSRKNETLFKVDPVKARGKIVDCLLSGRRYNTFLPD